MEIERKFLLKDIPVALEQYPSHRIEQGYLSTAPVVRVRQEDDTYYMTYKGSGMLAREEYNLPLTAESYAHLIKKADGYIITKRRYEIPLGDFLPAELQEDNKENVIAWKEDTSFAKEEWTALTVEYDVFEGDFQGLCLAEIEFPSMEMAEAFQRLYPFLPSFVQEVTLDGRFHNSRMSEVGPALFQGEE